jgi:opine dehydrogenase
MPAAKISSVAIVGAGNGGCAAAVELTQLGVEVRLCGRSAATIAPLQAKGGVEHEGALGEGFASIPIITTDTGEAMRGADGVIVMGPTQAHVAMAQAIAPHLKPEQVLFAAPGHTLTLLAHTLREAGHARPVTCETSTLPYICRKVTAERVKISRRAGRLKFAAFPAAQTDELAERLKPLFPAIAPVASLLDTVFPYTNAIHHPPAMLCNLGRIESTGGDYHHYYDGITPSVGRIIDALDDERCKLAAAFGCVVDSLPEYFFELGYTDEHGRSGGTAYATFHNSEPNRWIRAPASVDHRFFDEDVPYGLVPLTELGRLAGIAMPACHAVIALASIATGHDYAQAGLTLQRMGIAGLTVAELQALLAHGYD